MAAVDPARAFAILEVALECPDAERPALLDARCGGDAQLRAAVEAMLAADARAGALDTGVAGLPRLVADHLADAVVPRRLGEFEVLRELGRGGMGVVYEAAQADPARRVALKTAAPGLAPALVVAFRREAQAMATLLHVGIPQVYALFEHEGRPVIAMELVRGAPLHEAAALPLRERLELLIKIADAVEHAHARGVIHRDLKPANILVTADGQPKILDFGIASLGGADGAIAGTLAYVAPEQLRGAPPDRRADVYALAVVAWELLAGVSPIAVDGGRDRAALLAAKDRGPEATPAAIPAALADDLRRALAVDLEARPHTVAELRRAFERSLAVDALERLLAAAEDEHRRLVAAIAGGDDREIEPRFAAARFGYQQALALAPEHPRARAALDRCLHDIAAWRLDHGEHEIAAYHLGEAAHVDERLRARLARAPFDRRIAIAAALVFAAASLFLAALFATGAAPGYLGFALSSAALFLLGLALLARWRRILWARPRTRAYALLLLAIPALVSLIDLGAWLRRWPPERAHALVLPVLAAAALLLACTADRRWLLLATVHAALWLLAADAGESIYGVLLLAAVISFAFALWIARVLRSPRRSD